MARGKKATPYSLTFQKIAPPGVTDQLKEIGLTYRSAAKTKLISFGDLGESSVYRYEFSQQGGGVVFDANTETVTEDGVEGLIGGPSYLAIVRSGLRPDVEMATGLLGLVELTGRMPAGKTPHQVLDEMGWPEHIVNEAVFEHIMGTVSKIRDLELTFPEEKRKETTEASISESPGRVIENRVEANFAVPSIPTLRLADGSLQLTTPDGITTTAMSGNIADLAKGAGVPVGSLQPPNSQFPNTPPPSVTIPAATAAAIVDNHMDRNLATTPNIDSQQPTISLPDISGLKAPTPKPNVLPTQSGSPNRELAITLHDLDQNTPVGPDFRDSIAAITLRDLSTLGALAQNRTVPSLYER